MDVLMAVLMVADQAAMGTTESWCVARSDALDLTLQRALDYACSSGADCIPIQVDSLCYLPNTLQAHASYAFNSYFQRMARTPESCHFSGTSTLANSDPSYGSCVYPSTLSSAGGSIPSPPYTDGEHTPPTLTSTNTPWDSSMAVCKDLRHSFYIFILPFFSLQLISSTFLV